MNNYTQVIHGLYDKGILKFGEFTLKDGSKSDYYIDLRLLNSHPRLLHMVAECMSAYLQNGSTKFQYIAGIPLAGIPLSTLIGVYTEHPCLLLRKQAKDYGTKKLIEGEYAQNDNVLLVDDVITSAASKYEWIQILQDGGLVCNDVLVLVDRRRDLNQMLGFNLHAVFTIGQIFKTLLDYDKVSACDRTRLMIIMGQSQ